MDNNESFYGDKLMDWLREVCIIETEDEVYYDAESFAEKEIELFINNLKALANQFAGWGFEAECFHGADGDGILRFDVF